MSTSIFLLLASTGGNVSFAGLFSVTLFSLTTRLPFAGGLFLGNSCLVPPVLLTAVCRCTSCEDRDEGPGGEYVTGII